MWCSSRVLVAVALVLVSSHLIAATESKCGGMLAAVYHMNKTQDASDCAFVIIDYDGSITWRSWVPTICKDAQPTNDFRMAQAHYGWGSDPARLFITTGTGKFVYTIQVYSGVMDTAPWAVLPANYDFILGMAYAKNMLWIATTTTLLVVPSAGGSALPSIYFDTVGGLTVSAVMATNSNDTLFIADGPKLVIINLNTFKASVVTMNPVTKPMDIQYFARNNTLLIVDTYRLFAVDFTTGLGTKILNVPNGPGFPRVNTGHDIDWVFADFVRMYTVDLNAQPANVSSVALFDSIPLVGYFQYFF